MRRFRSMGVALRFAERMLIGGARRNAWAAVCENRRIAADRDYGATRLLPLGDGTPRG